MQTSDLSCAMLYKISSRFLVAVSGELLNFLCQAMNRLFNYNPKGHILWPERCFFFPTIDNSDLNQVREFGLFYIYLFLTFEILCVGKFSFFWFFNWMITYFTQLAIDFIIFSVSFVALFYIFALKDYFFI